MVEITICTGGSCHLKNSKGIIDTLKKEIINESLNKKIVLNASICMNDCNNGVCIRVNGKKLTNMSLEKIPDLMKEIKAAAF